MMHHYFSFSHSILCGSMKRSERKHPSEGVRERERGREIKSHHYIHCGTKDSHWWQMRKRVQVLGRKVHSEQWTWARNERTQWIRKVKCHCCCQLGLLHIASSSDVKTFKYTQRLSFSSSCCLLISLVTEVHWPVDKTCVPPARLCFSSSLAQPCEASPLSQRNRDTSRLKRLFIISSKEKHSRVKFFFLFLSLSLFICLVFRFTCFTLLLIYFHWQRTCHLGPREEGADGRWAPT